MGSNQITIMSQLKADYLGHPPLGIYSFLRRLFLRSWSRAQIINRGVAKFNSRGQI